MEGQGHEWEGKRGSGMDGRRLGVIREGLRWDETRREDVGARR